ncbi:MAG: hypothetical protein LBC80_05680 [Treponema sp.]|jgi:hypothetical protein|nr:hypothetical protein [Treponema sp.]
MKKKSLFTVTVLAFGAFFTSCATTAPFAFTDTFNVSSDHFREMRTGPWETIGNTQYRLIFNHEEKIVDIRGRGSTGEDKKDNMNFRTKKPSAGWFSDAEERIKIHSGFFRRYESVRSVLLDAVYEYPDYAIHVSGFSLGGTWTQLFLLDILLLWPDRDIKAIFYAPASPWRKLPRKYQKELKQCTVFVRTYWDPITWMWLIGFHRYGYNITVGKWWRILPPQHEPPQMIRALDELLK